MPLILPNFWKIPSIPSPSDSVKKELFLLKVSVSLGEEVQCLALAARKDMVNSRR